MDQSRFDQLVRVFSRSLHRRGLLGAAGGLAALAMRPARASQLPATCAQTGQVCTMLYGCCSGLTCATSSINPSYGVCVPGEGGMVTTGTSLVVPFDSSDTTQSQTVTDSVTDTTTSTTTTTTTTQEDRKARIQARKAEIKSRRSSRKSEQQTRQDSQQDRRQDRKTDADTADGPDLSFRLVLSSASNKAELLRVTNSDSVTVYLTQIESLLDPDARGVLQNLSIGPGDSYVFRSNDSLPTTNDPDATGETTWWETSICTPATESDGFVVSAAFSSNGTVTEYTVLCDGSFSPDNTNSSGDGRGRKRRKNQNSGGKQKSRGKGK